MVSSLGFRLKSQKIILMHLHMNEIGLMLAFLLVHSALLLQHIALVNECESNEPDIGV